jgi:hypothetical protein
MVSFRKFSKKANPAESPGAAAAAAARHRGFPHMVAPLFVGRTQIRQCPDRGHERGQDRLSGHPAKANIDNPDAKRTSADGHGRQGAAAAAAARRNRQGPGGGRRHRARIVRFITEKEFSRSSWSGWSKPSSPRRRRWRSCAPSSEELRGICRPQQEHLQGSGPATSPPSPTLPAGRHGGRALFLQAGGQAALLEIDLSERLSLLLSLIKMEIEVFRMDQRIKSRVKDQMEKTQKQYYLNEQMRAIKKEMGAEDDAERRARTSSRKAHQEQEDVQGAAEQGRARAEKAQDDDAHVGRGHRGPQLHRLDHQPALADKTSEVANDIAGREDPGRRPLRAGETQGAHSGIPGGAGAGGKDARADPVLRRAARGSARPRWPNPWRGRPAASSSGCPWAACGTRRRSGGTAGPTSAPCPARSSSR